MEGNDVSVKFSEQRLFQLFSEVDGLQKKRPSTEDYYAKIESILPYPCQLATHSNVETLRNLIRKYTRKKDKRLPITKIIDQASTALKFTVDIPSPLFSPAEVKSSCSSPSISINDSSSLSQAITGFSSPNTSTSGVNTDIPLDEAPGRKKARCSEDFTATFSTSNKQFSDLTERQRREKTRPLIDMLESFLGHNKFTISSNQLLGYLLMRGNATKTPLYLIGKKIYSETLEDEVNFSPLEAVSLVHTLDMSKEQTRKLKQFLSMKNVNFPTTNELLPMRKSLRPNTTLVMEGKGRAVDYAELVSYTAASVIRVVLAENPSFLQESSPLTMHLKDGGDGAGTMPFLKSKDSVDDGDHIFQYGIIPLKLTKKVSEENNEVVWKNPVPNSARSLRPVYLIREVETDSDLLDLVIKNTDNLRNELNQNGMNIAVGNESVHVSFDIKDTMKDLKFKKLISGLGGADCILCKSKVKDWTDLTKIQEGFKIDRTAADTRKIFESVLEDGEIRIKPKDFALRSGVTKEPLSDSDQHNITITHSYINGCTWFMKVLYRCHSDYQKWEEKTGLEQILQKSKDTVRDTIKERTGLRLDYVCSAGGKGGTSTDGKQGRRFFSGELNPVINDLLATRSTRKHRVNMLQLHKQISIILRIISCTRKINIKKFEEHCTETMINIATNFPWVLLNHTLHGAIQHSAELIEMNGGESLGWYSEEGLEANNKDIRNFLEHLSRKTGTNQQIEDVMNRLLERSDPYLGSITTRYIQGKSCSICEATDHTARSHTKCDENVDGLEEFFIQ